MVGHAKELAFCVELNKELANHQNKPCVVSVLMIYDLAHMTNKPKYHVNVLAFKDRLGYGVITHGFDACGILGASWQDLVEYAPLHGRGGVSFMQSNPSK